MQRKHNKSIVGTARMLRKNMTKQERHLWYDFLSAYPVKFTRQKILGKYIADFYCASANLVIELDGNQHAEERYIIKDAERTAYIEQFGIKVIRIANGDITDNFDGVCEYIDELVRTSVTEE